MPFIPDQPLSRFVPDEGQPAIEQESSPLDIAKAATRFSPPAIALKINEKANELLGKTAYEAGGKVTDITGSPGLGFAANVAAQSVPMLLGGQGAKAAAPALEAGAKAFMQSALKPSIRSLKNGDAAKAISTMLDEGINVTKGGVEKLRVKISELNDQIVQAISASPATVDKNKVASELLGTLKKFEKQANPQADTKAIKKAWKNFQEHPLLPKIVPEQTVPSAILNERGQPFTTVIPASGTNEIPVQLAQEMKQATYRSIGDKAYGELGTASKAAQKDLARGLKEGVAQAAPEVAGLNAKESALINALKLAEHRSLVEGNKNLGGLAWLSSNPATWAAFMADKSSAFKSIVARMLHSGKEQIPATGARLGIATYEASQQP